MALLGLVLLSFALMQITEATNEEIEALMNKADGLAREVDQLQTSKDEMTSLLRSLNAARMKDIRELREEFREAINETRERLEEQNSELAELDYEIAVLNGSIATTTAYVQTTVPQTTQEMVVHDCDFQYAGYCYFLIIWHMNQHYAYNACKKKNATLGYPVDHDSYMEIRKVARAAFPPNTGRYGWAGFWTGLRSWSTTVVQGPIKLFNGDLAPFTKWAYNEPSGGWNEANIILKIYPSGGGLFEGMDDVNRGLEFSGAVCMYRM